MQRKLLPLLSVLAVLSVAVGGATAAGGDAIGASTPDSGDAEVGICLVGADSPCNAPDDETAATHPTPINDSHEASASERDAVPIGDADENAEAGICLVGADSPCNGDSSPPQGEPIAPDDGEGQLWIPEDQNRDGDIDDRFLGDDLPVLGGLPGSLLAAL